MNTPLSFTVVVTSCCNCPNADMYTENCLLEYKHERTAEFLFTENKDQLTKSCPMIIKQEESK